MAGAIDVVMVGCGKITNLRHIGAVRADPRFRITGLVGTDSAQLEKTASRVPDARAQVADLTSDDLPDWIQEAKLLVVGTPPRTHAPLAVRLAAECPGALILVEKPLVVTESDRDAMQGLVDRPIPVAVMHNFQFANGFRRTLHDLRSGAIGELRSVQAFQWSTKDRRLPMWYRELPLGLFWDEGAHFFYLLEAILEEFALQSAFSFVGNDPGDPTPSVLGASYLGSGGEPAEISMHFDAGISEWGLILCGSRGTLLYDMFRDIPIRLPYDGQHLTREVLRTSMAATSRHWFGVARNGIKIVGGRQHWGIDEVFRLVGDSIEGRDLDARISVGSGLRITDRMRALVAAAGTAPVEM